MPEMVDDYQQAELLPTSFLSYTHAVALRCSEFAVTIIKASHDIPRRSDRSDCHLSDFLQPTALLITLQAAWMPSE